MQHRRTKWVWIDGFSSGIWKWECFCTVECQQVEFQVDGAPTETARRASSVCMRGTTSIGASEERRAQGGVWVCTISLRYVRAAVVRLWNQLPDAFYQPSQSCLDSSHSLVNPSSFVIIATLIIHQFFTFSLQFTYVFMIMGLIMCIN